MVVIGQCLIVLGLIVLLVPFQIILLPGFFLVGLGCAPIFPSLLHETPRNFGEKYSQAIIGIQMASAYVGITVMPLLFGRIASWFSYSFFLWFIGIVLLVQVYMNYALNRIVKKKL